MTRRVLPQAPREYDSSFQSQLINELEVRDGQSVKMGERVEINGKDNTQVVLIAANGTKYKLQVDNSGNLSTTAV
tara:strand:+ start:480 stop:704 length:225 start_codon:yes stop_codon:yes gene_type:complete